MGVAAGRGSYGRAVWPVGHGLDGRRQCCGGFLDSLDGTVAWNMSIDHLANILPIVKTRSILYLQPEFRLGCIERPSRRHHSPHECIQGFVANNAIAIMRKAF